MARKKHAMPQFIYVLQLMIIRITRSKMHKPANLTVFPYFSPARYKQLKTNVKIKGLPL